MRPYPADSLGCQLCALTLADRMPLLSATMRMLEPSLGRYWATEEPAIPTCQRATGATSSADKEKSTVSMTGELVTETLEYDGGRQVTVYVPLDSPEAVVFAGDGQLISQWGGVLEAADVPPTMIVGAHRPADETLRLHEYSPVFDPNRFAAHERFFVHDVRRWAGSRFGLLLPAERTAVFGVSAGAELALALGLRHPDVYGAVFCASPGAGYEPPSVMPRTLPRTYLVAGTLEPFFRQNATRWAVALGGAGADVVMTERVGSHGDTFWRDELPRMVTWAFGDDVSRP